MRTSHSLKRLRCLRLGFWLVVYAVGALIPDPPATARAWSYFEQATASRCSLDSATPEVIVRGNTDLSEWHGRFDLPDVPHLWEPAPPDEFLSQFRDMVRNRLGTDVDERLLLERQRKIFAVMPAEWSGEASNVTVLLEGEVGNISPISCLEAMLWKWQSARYPMLEHPTEFGAFVLQMNGRVRVYLSSADLVGQKINRTVTEMVQADVSSGFRLVSHIHNHPFLFDRQVGDRMWTTEATKGDVAGALAPSMTDVQFFRNLRDSLGLQEAWITNGIHSSRFRRGDFDRLTSR
jgi:hypothetical protein